MLEMIRKTLTEIPIQMRHWQDAKIHLQHPDLIRQQLSCGIPRTPQQTMITFRIFDHRVPDQTLNSDIPQSLPTDGNLNAATRNLCPSRLEGI